MKRTISVAFTIAALCSLFLPAIIAPVNAAAAGYSHMVYPLQNDVTFDGKWTGTNEWTDGELTPFGTTALFVSKWGPFVDASTVPQYFLVEILNDNTNDQGDYWQFCFDGDMSGGATPQGGDVRIDIVGHNNVTFYQGTGTGWAPMATPGAGDFQWSNSMSTSPYSSASHWILELRFNKPPLSIGPQYWARVAVFDASSGAVVKSWPPTSRDVPSDWGDFPYSSTAIPESSSFSAVLLLSSVAVLVGYFFFRKKKIGNLANNRLVR